MSETEAREGRWAGLLGLDLRRAHDRMVCDAVMAHADAERADAWDEATEESFDLGWTHDKARDDVRERNPYRDGVKA